jgi:formate dehydrogenase alpha subunit
MVTLTIDGIEVTVERGTTILEAAQQAGIRVPTLCHDKRLVPYGSCRLCMVEVTARGRTRKMPSCFNPARDGMEVATNTPDLITGRRMQLMLLLRSHPLMCPTCDAGGNCRLQDLVHEYQIEEPPFTRESRSFHVDNSSHFIRFNMNLCIRCGMCVRICNEVQGVNELSFVNRGMEIEVSTDFDRPLDCEFCGQCVSVCPVGAISSKWLVGTGRDFELKDTNTICSFCSLGCELSLRVKARKVVYVTSPQDSPNEGNLCVKGRYGWPYVYSDKRLTKPLIRKQGSLEEVEWNEALNFVANGFSKIKEASGPAALAALGSERLTNEEAYVFNRFVRTVLETPHLDHAGGYGYRPLVDGLGATLGYPASPNSIREIRKANLIVLFGADLTETHPVAKNEVIFATGPFAKGRVVVVDSIKTKLSDCAGIHMSAVPGTEHLIAYAMLKEIVDQNQYDRKALDLVAEGFDDLVASLADYSPDNVATLTGVEADSIRQAATEYAKAENATIIMTAGMNRIGNGVALAQAAAALALVTGRIGKQFNGLHLFGEKANSQGAIDMGLAPDLLPGFKSILDEEARKKFEAAWEASLPSEKGLDAQAILESARNKDIRGMYVVGENPLETYPDREQTKKSLESLEFLVVQDLFLTPTAEMAHVVLPVTSFAGKIGTYTSADRRVQRLRPVLNIPGPKSDLEIFQSLSDLMGKPGVSYAGPEQIMDEIAELVEVYEGISYRRLEGHGLPWPCLDNEDPGQEMLYEGGFPREKAWLAPAPPCDAPSADGLPMVLVPGILKFHSGSFSQWSASLMEVSPEGTAEMNRADMKSMGFADGDSVRITDATGFSIVMNVKRSRRAVEGSVIVPQHFASLKLNNLTRWDQPLVKVQVGKI